MKNIISFSQQARLGNDLEYAKKNFHNKKKFKDSYFSNKVEQLLKKQLNIKEKTLLTTSHEIAALINLKPGDEVIVPSYFCF